MLSRPLGIHWAGWETNTARLQGCGWDLAVEFEYYRHQYRLLMRHEHMELYAISDMLHIEQMMEAPDRYLEHAPVFNVVQVASSFQSMSIPHVDFAAFQQIDAKPQIVDYKIQRVEDFNIFALARGKAQEILVNKADMSVIEHLEAIKRLQEPAQHEIRQRMIREQETAVPARNAPKLHLVAQLVHLEEAA